MRRTTLALPTRRWTAPCASQPRRRPPRVDNRGSRAPGARIRTWSSWRRAAGNQALVHINECAPAQWTRGPRDPAADKWTARVWGWERGTSGRAPLEVETDGEGPVHDACEQRGRPLQTARHRAPLPLAQLRPKARLPPIRGPHPRPVIAAGETKLGEEPRPPRAVDSASSSASMCGSCSTAGCVMALNPR